MTDTTDLACKFTARIERKDGRYVVELPETEIEYGTLDPGDVCRISVHYADATSGGQASTDREEPTAPVSVGEQHTVEIEDVGDEGDGITRVERGYVLIVPDAAPGDEVTVEITEVNPNFGFAEVVEDDRDHSAGTATGSRADTV